MEIVTRLTHRISELRQSPEPRFALTDALNELTMVLLPVDMPRALHYQQEALRTAQKADYAAGAGLARLTIGWMHFWHGNTRLALMRGDETIKMGERLGDARLNAYGGDLVAATMSALGQMGDSLGYGMHLLEIFELAGDVRGVAQATNIIALGFAELGDMQEAESRLKHALQLWQSYGDDYECAMLHNNLVRITTRARRYDAAMRWADTCAEKCEALERSLNLKQPLPLWAYLYRNIAALHFDLGDLEQAERYCRRSIAANDANSDRALSLLCRQKGLLGQILKARGEHDQAVAEFDAALGIADQYQFVAPLIEGHVALYAHYKAQGDHKNALFHLERCRSYERQLYTRVQSDRNRTQDALRKAEAARRQANKLHERTFQLESLVGELRALQHQLRDMSVRDSLTGLLNRRYLDERLPKVWDMPRAAGEQLALLLIDIDDFKQINDSFRHQIGDDVLVKLGAILDSLKQGDEFVVRYGGEEFLLVLPSVHRSRIQERAEQVRFAVEQFAWHTLSPTLHVTISVGVAMGNGYPDHYALLRAADEHLYRAKQQGKNRVVLSEAAELH